MARTKWELVFNTFASFPSTWALNVFYIATDTNTTYYWNWTTYVSLWSSWSIVVTWNTTAVNDWVYVVVANATFTDPTPVEWKGYTVIVRNWTATIWWVWYSVAWSEIIRIFHSWWWSSYLKTPSSWVNTWDQTITLTWDVTWSWTWSFAVTLANSWVTAWTYNNVTIDWKWRVTNWTNQSYLTWNQTITLSWDITWSWTTSITWTLSNTWATAWSYTNANITVDAKWRITAVSNWSSWASWGSSISWTSWTWFLTTISDSASAWVIWQSIVIWNTQTNAVVWLNIDWWTSSIANKSINIDSTNTALRISAQIRNYASATQATQTTFWLYCWLNYNTSSTFNFTWIAVKNEQNWWTWTNTWYYLDNASTDFSSWVWAWMRLYQSWVSWTLLAVTAVDNVNSSSNWLVNYTISNTQSWASVIQKIDLWTSTQWHTGLQILASWASTSQRWITINTSSWWTWIPIEFITSWTSRIAMKFSTWFTSATATAWAVASPWNFTWFIIADVNWTTIKIPYFSN